MDTVAVPVENNIEQASHIDDKEKERGRKTTINIALYTASLLLTAGNIASGSDNLIYLSNLGLGWCGCLFLFIILLVRYCMLACQY